jgi:hypothetical protein
LTGGRRCRRTSWGCLARESAKIPEVVEVNNYQKKGGYEKQNF